MRTHMASVFLTTTMVFSLLLSPSPVAAWEDDVHYGLTKWLALRAGFKDAAAERIARGNVDSDAGILDARHLVFWYACVNPDINASKLVRDLHFPGDGPVPGMPAERAVGPGSIAAWSQVELELRRPVGNPSQMDKALEYLGRALHALQDSWSHQGTPGIPGRPPLLCNRLLAWGHPDRRGGWRDHIADYTYRWPSDILAAAEGTWKALLAHAKQKKGVIEREPREWVSLINDIKEFGSAQTKTEKAKWFGAQGFKDKDVDLIARAAVPDGEQPLSDDTPPRGAAPGVEALWRRPTAEV